jgi:hypothetical protein
LKAFHECFKGMNDEVSYVEFEVAHQGSDTVRKTRVTRNGVLQRESEMTPIRRK